MGGRGQVMGDGRSMGVTSGQVGGAPFEMQAEFQGKSRTIRSNQSSTDSIAFMLACRCGGKALCRNDNNISPLASI